MKIFKEKEQEKRQHKFSQTYENWKQKVRTARAQLKHECTEIELGNLVEEVEGQESMVLQAYDAIRTREMTKWELSRRVDACVEVTRDIKALLQHRVTEAEDNWDDHRERERLHSLLDQECAQSVYGSLLNPSIASPTTKSIVVVAKVSLSVRL